MRTLKLQMDITLDGFVASSDGKVDWMVKYDPQAWGEANRFIDTSDTLLMGRRMVAGFMTYWESVKTSSDEYAFAQKMLAVPKIVFSHTLKEVKGENTRLERGDLATVVKQLKEQSGKDILVYGGASFVNALIEHDLIDQLNFFVNPVAIGKGKPIFTSRKPFTLTGSAAFPCGVVLNTYNHR